MRARVRSRLEQTNESRVQMLNEKRVREDDRRVTQISLVTEKYAFRTVVVRVNSWHVAARYRGEAAISSAAVV